MTAVLGSVVDLAEMYDTCGLCTGGGVVLVAPDRLAPLALALEPCPVCRTTGLSRLCPDCAGTGHHAHDDQTGCDTCGSLGEVA
ncbi:MAG: hypothetical protein M3548_02465 [Actinomycetota bacterium]|nr:hypothetical protein [Actinomycetota bacterium]